MNSLKEIADFVQEPGFDRVLVACHRSPDGDACGSAYALVWALRRMGKKAKVFCADPFGKEFSYLLAMDETQEDFEPEHFVTVDVADPEMLCGAEFTERLDLCLDHHRINRVEAKKKYVDHQSASCGEIILLLLKEMGLNPDRRISAALYTAISTDTGLCRYSNTNEDTFLALAELSRYAEKGDFYQINKILFETKSFDRLKLESYGVEKVRFGKNGRIAYLLIPRSEQERLGANYEDLNVLVNVIRQIEGVIVAMVIKEREAGVWKVSVRSEAPFDASEFCAQFGGGGHVAAAGCALQGEEAKVEAALLREAEGRLS